MKRDFQCPHKLTLATLSPLLLSVLGPFLTQHLLLLLCHRKVTRLTPSAIQALMDPAVVTLGDSMAHPVAGQLQAVALVAVQAAVQAVVVQAVAQDLHYSV